MPAVVPAPKHTDPLSKTIPFNRMAPARLTELLAHGRPSLVNAGESLFSESDIPTEVFVILRGTVCTYADMLGEDDPVFLDEQGPGACIGWLAAISQATGVRPVATTEVEGIVVPASSFVEITRRDPGLRKAFFAKTWKEEIWRSILAEMERRTGRIVSAAGIVERVGSQCVALEWPEDQDAIAMQKNRVWVVIGGDGVNPGERWHGGDGVRWARIIGLPEPHFTNALLERPPATARVCIRGAARHSAISHPSVQKGSAGPASAALRPVPPRENRRRNGALRALAVALAAVIFIVGCVAKWASRQWITQRISQTGHLVFSGESKTLTAGVAGVLSEFDLVESQRIQPGTTVAVIRPPLDEAGARRLTEEITRLEKDAGFCDATLKGTRTDPTAVAPALIDLAEQHAKLTSELRVLGAIERTDPDDPALTVPERERVASYFKSINRERDERLTIAARDVSARHDDLRDAENALRDAQSEALAHVQAFSGATSGDKKEVEQEMRDYRRVLASLNRAVAVRRETVNRIRREIEMLRPEAQPDEGIAADAPSVRPDILNTTGALADIEVGLKSNSEALHAKIAIARQKLDQIRKDAAPRQIKVIQSGYTIEAAKLQKGAAVRPDTIIGRIITRNTWQIDCNFPSPAVGTIRSGEELAITVADRYATLVYAPYTPSSGTPNRVDLIDSKDEWRDGMAVRVETTLVTGNLLEHWLEKIGITTH